jgi:hypothetical protein
LDDVKKQLSRNLPGCEVSVFALVHGEHSKLDRFQKEVADEIQGAKDLAGCEVSNAGDIKLNKGLDGTPYGILRIIVVRILSKQWP